MGQLGKLRLDCEQPIEQRQLGLVFVGDRAEQLHLVLVWLFFVRLAVCRLGVIFFWFLFFDDDFFYLFWFVRVVEPGECDFVEEVELEHVVSQEVAQRVGGQVGEGLLADFDAAHVVDVVAVAEVDQGVGERDFLLLLFFPA